MLLCSSQPLRGTLQFHPCSASLDACCSHCCCPRPLLAGAGCGGDDGDDEGDSSISRPAPAASDFPAAQGQSLEQVLGNATGQGPVVSPAARVLRVGENRFPFGVFTVEREQITGAEVAIYAAPKNVQGPAIGPFPARIESLETEAAFVARSTAADPDSGKAVYVSEVPLEKPGAWTFAALVKEGDGFTGTVVPAPSEVGQFDPVDVGDRAPSVSTPTADEVADIAEIDTRVSRPAPCTMSTFRTCSARSPSSSPSRPRRSARAASAARWSTSPSR